MTTARIILSVCLPVALALLPARARAQDGGPELTGCGQVIGKPCIPGGAGECGLNAFCLAGLDPAHPGQGMCTCSCTADDPRSDLINEDSCPDHWKHFCALGNICLKRCQPRLGANDCQAPFACLPASSLLTGDIDKAACFLVGCTSDADCPVFTGKICATVADCGAGEQCVSWQESPLTICAKPGTCDTASGLCDKHADANPAAKVGDPCKADTDCGQYMSCVFEHDPKALGLKDHGEPCTHGGECCSFQCTSKGCAGACAPVFARNGYCTIVGCAFATATAFSEFACPAGSDCSRWYLYQRWGGWCLRSCRLSVASDCRGHPADQAGDYECRAWNNLGRTQGPVCEIGSVMSCVLSTDIPSLNCSMLGEDRNPTQMTCRRLDGTPTIDPHDPQGFCFDDTTSAPILDAGVPDAAPDQGARDWGGWPDLGPNSPDVGGHLADGDGCSCRLAGRHGFGPHAVLLLLALLPLRRRSR